MRACDIRKDRGIRLTLNEKYRGTETRAALNRRKREKAVGFDFRHIQRTAPLSVLLAEIEPAPIYTWAAEDIFGITGLIDDSDKDHIDMEVDDTDWDDGDYHPLDHHFFVDDADLDYRSGYYSQTGAYVMPEDDFEDDSDEEIADDKTAYEEALSPFRTQDVFSDGGHYTFMKNVCGCQKAVLDPDREVNATAWALA